MKNLKKGLTLLLGILVSGSTMAMKVVRVDTVPGQNDEALVNILDAQDSKFEVDIKDSYGDIVYSYSNISPSFDYKKIFDFSRLEDGQYTFEVNVGDETEINNLIVKNGHVQVFNEKEDLSPKFNLDGKYLNFTFPDSEHKTARLMLYNEDSDKLVFQERLSSEFNVDQALNLSNLGYGNYRVEIITGDNTYDYDFYLG